MSPSTIKNTTKQINTLLEELKHSVAEQPTQSTKEIRQLGLVITQNEEASESVIKIVEDQTDDKDFTGLSISNPGVNASFKDKLSAGMRNDSVVAVNIQSDINQRVAGILKKISQDNELNSDDLSSTLDYGNSRIICVITEDQLQSISYPHFIDIFGPVIRI